MRSAVGVVTEGARGVSGTPTASKDRASLIGDSTPPPLVAVTAYRRTTPS
ncbi:MAG: hypothetical protein IPM08_15310 [Actinomycetales bacterium]|nr:hypothetical protein [Actinomycetales bacterium]